MYHFIRKISSHKGARVVMFFVNILAIIENAHNFLITMFYLLGESQFASPSSTWSEQKKLDCVFLWLPSLECLL